MIRALTPHIKWLLAILVVLAAFGAAEALAGSVETYVDEAVPPVFNAGPGQPLSPGDLTMQDILKSSATAKAIEKKREEAIRRDALADKARLTPLAAGPSNIKAPVLLAPATAPVALAPQLQPSPNMKSAGSLLIQGMQSIYGQPTSGASSLHAPDVPGAPAVAPVQTATVVKGVSVSPLPEVGTPMTTGAATGPCTPQTSSWIKSCAEAGYPENYVGQIRGETRTTCPAGNLQDVWISNGCVPPENGPSAAPTALTSPSTAPAAVASVATSSEPVDASCGPANGLAASSRPTYDLCVSGYASPVSGDGPWHWSCQGKNGGMTVSCAAPVATAAANAPSAVAAAAPNSPAAEDAECGAANGIVADNAPSANLCFKGAASRVNGSGPWTWACSGANGGKAAACNAPKKIEGVCGAANGSGSDEMPMSDLCAAGFASAVTGSGPWAWTCSGLNGGQAATCSAEPRANAVCGPASLSGHGDMPKNALCSVGLPSAVSGTGPWNWTCAGLNGGASVSCGAQISQNGMCGLAHGTSSASAPTDNLCAVGRATSVTGNGPWNWTCLGSDGGDTASCTAARTSQHVPVPVAPVPPPKPAAPAAASPTASSPVSIAPVQPPATAAAVADAVNLCGDASEFVAIEAPIKNLCKSGNASALSGNGPWSWTCSDHGTQSYCSTLDLAGPSKESAAPVAAPAATPAPTVAAPQTATCGSAAGQGASQEPSSGLCAVGKASPVLGNGPWTWNCTKGKSRTSCQAAKLADGACGAANGSVQRNAPATGLCNAGAPTPVQGNGPWIWSCIGSGGGASISCSAASQAQTRVDGSCGVAANSALSSAPAANLCDSGVASGVYGSGPWTWTCSGLNGGAAASCAARKNTLPAPPPPGPAVNGLCGSSNGLAMIVQPMDNLCTTGTATAVSGNGPWNWNCIGENSGMTVSCTAPLQPPAPISGVCGQANGVPTLTTPKSGLCSGGISSAVSGKGPWTWSCSGVNGGGAVGCVAPLAGSNVGSLPSMTTQSGEAPAPMAAPTASVAKRGLVTPRMPSGSLPPIQTGSLPAATRVPDMSVPPEAPQLPDGTEGVPPPPVRDYIQPAPGLRTDNSGNVLPGNHFTLDADLASMPFVRGSDNFDTSVAAKLDKLANVLAGNGGVRVTLTAYADNSGTTPREARRLSLSRALAIRDYLTAKGISSGRIDVRALGANVPSGEPDRVDIKPN